MSGDSASSSAATPLAANASTSAFLTTPRSCSGDASKSEAQPSRRHPCERLRSLTRLLVGPPVRKAARLRRQMSAYDLFDLRDAKLEIRCRGRNCQKMLRQKQILFFDEQLFERVHRSDNN